MRRLLPFAVLALLVACGSSSPKAITKNGVTVKASLSHGSLSVTFTPQAGFHLYDTALPVGGADGVGLATRVTVGGSLQATGTATADQQVKDITVAGVSGPVPVYPTGPVTFTVPVSGSKGTATVQYAACSDALCLPPVEGLAVTVG